METGKPMEVKIHNKIAVRALSLGLKAIAPIVKESVRGEVRWFADAIVENMQELEDQAKQNQ